MSLILAIEPDRRQVAHLISIVRHVKGAELVLADTTERALESIGNSVPDLILVPALLSPQDDAALAAALRVIATAAHVQMLTIPTFAVPKPKQKRGVLSAFRRKPVDDAPLEGCDPKVFAEEIASYLERANEERAAAQLYEEEQETLAPPESAPEPGFDEPAEEFAAADDSAANADEDVLALRDSSADDIAPLETVNDADSLAASPALDEPAAAADAGPVEPLPSTIVEDDTASFVGPAAAEAASAVAWDPETTAIPEEAVAAPEQDELPPSAPEAPSIFVSPVEPPSLEPDVVDEPEAPDHQIAATASAAEMALDEFVATLEHSSQAVEEEPVAAAPDTGDIVELPAFEDLLADFERANLPVIEEVHAEQWMADAEEPVQGADDTATEDETDDVDIDLSIELDAVLRADDTVTTEPAQPFKPFEPTVPVERIEPPPLAAWQAWPRLAMPEPSMGPQAGNGNGNGHEAPEPEHPPVADFDQVAEFEEALELETALERFEPVVPVERVEPMPLAAWRCWPQLEGVTAEAYEEPIAPRKAVAKPEWVELMRSLREDIARRRAELAATGPVEPPKQKPLRARAEEPPAPLPKPVPSVDAAKKRPKRTRPIEDEWGLFDPEQCGFAALLDKLDEITAALPNAQQRRPPR